VQGIIQPSNDSHIRFEVRLPTSGWNGKYVDAGNDYFHGLTNYDSLADAVYAGSSTNVGHKDDETNWMDHPEKVIDWGYRAMHETSHDGRQGHMGSTAVSCGLFCLCKRKPGFWLCSEA